MQAHTASLPLPASHCPHGTVILVLPGLPPGSHCKRRNRKARITSLALPAFHCWLPTGRLLHPPSTASPALASHYHPRTACLPLPALELPTQYRPPPTAHPTPPVAEQLPFRVLQVVRCVHLRHPSPLPSGLHADTHDLPCASRAFQRPRVLLSASKPSPVPATLPGLPAPPPSVSASKRPSAAWSARDPS